MENVLSRPLVEPLMRSIDAEVAERARRIVARHHQTHLQRYLRYGREGQIERMVEGICSWPGPIESEPLWKGVRGVALRIWEPLNPPRSLAPPNDFMTNMERAKKEPIFCRLTGPLVENIWNGGYASTGPLTADGNFANAHLVSTGSISVRGATAAALLLTCEDFLSGEEYRESKVTNVMVVSAGRVVLRRRVDRSFIIARGDIDVTGCAMSGNQFVTAGKIVGADKLAPGSRLTEQVPPENTLRLIKWFETSSVGFEAKAADGGIKVVSVVPDSEAGKAGLKTDDLIITIDNRPVDKTVEGFRKQLRRGSVQDQCLLTVRRGSTTSALTLDFRADNRK